MDQEKVQPAESLLAAMAGLAAVAMISMGNGRLGRQVSLLTQQ